ncbi:polysaccharide deacetylase family protein [Pannonibacter tanglangensis]|nr:polysaccharide deacetylase family protein [Pannonibacter sp. XCT-34]
MQTIVPKPSGSAGLKEMVRAGLSVAATASGVSRLLARRYAGRGVILMFHEFTRSPRALLGQGCHIDDFDAILTALRAAGRDFVSLDEALERCADPAAAPFAVLTFDDGYRSNIELALPVMERHGAPATIFVPTGMVTRDINAWWLGLRQLALDLAQIDMEPMGERLVTGTWAEKKAALDRMTAWVWADFARASLLPEVFRGHGIALADVVDLHVLDAAGIVAADRHPLLRIEAHTTTHRALRLLDEDALRADIGANKIFLEELLQRPVRWFAYPYGRPSIGGTREAEVVRSLGFRGAVTTDPGGLFPAHHTQSFLLPRQNGEVRLAPVAHARAGADGLFRALASRGGTPCLLPGDF